MTHNPESTADREVVIRRIFKFSRSVVFDALIDPVNIGKWWGPNGFTTTTKRMDVRLGGEWVFIMHGPDGVDFPNWIRYREIVRPERLVLDHGGETPDAPVQFQATITLAEHPDGTALVMRSLFPTKEMRDLVVNNYGAIEGGHQHLARLAEHLSVQSTGAPSAYDRELTASRRIRASRATIWSALTNADVLATWWGPNGFTNTFTTCDMRPGGEWHLTMHGPDGASHPNRNRFAELQSSERWVIEHTESHPFQLALTLTECGDETEVHLRQTFANRQDCADLRSMCEPANKQNLDRLAEAVGKLSATPRRNGDKPFIITRTFIAPRELVWRAWTDAKELSKWFGPKGSHITQCTMDLRPGGSFHYCLQTADGMELWAKWTFREIVAPERLVMLQSFSDAHGGITAHPLAPTWPRQMISRTTFTEESGKTTIEVNWLVWNGTEGEHAMFDGAHDSMTQGWGGTLDRLTDYLAVLPATTDGSRS